MSTKNKLRELRGSLTQEQIAVELGITKSAWAMYERGERIPRDEVKVKIANYFACSLEELFYPNYKNKKRRLDEAQDEKEVV